MIMAVIAFLAVSTMVVFLAGVVVVNMQRVMVMGVSIGRHDGQRRTIRPLQPQPSYML
ncbi:hypothetical protein [Streptomyces sp. NPDC051993]|uniref:hypothetical protein n=1 Tax=Streptomyces sp. NPDC051993 TaxID=3155286 RepID=UPI003422D2A6